MNLTFDNIFLGAEVYQGTKKLIVYKINQKTFYAGEMDFEVFFNRYKISKGTTFKDFVASVKADLYSYEGFTITEIEVEKGKKIGVKKIDKDDKKFLSPKAEKTLKDIIETRVKKGRNCNYPLYDGNKEFHIVVAREDGKILLNMDDEYILFNVETRKYYKIENVFEGKLKEDNIPFDKC